MAKRDLITKDFALYVVHYFNAMQTWNKEDILSEIDRTIKEAKPEDAVPVVHAKWVDVREKRLWGEQYFLCSRCKSRNGLMIKFNYCPNCGARMDGE